ncbi:trypsin-like peptidase domain-containing protein [Streptomyces sulphureus]|uniref:trypsin-like peptidase domain-containing protein n=1 Tax=Streptomyces sulphureus TaxID=47758 RepID=UPI00035FABCB|nr:trypsin-like peptidase domain-containing protein [Streptomyces sulphureus]
MSAVRSRGALARVCGPDGRVRGTAFAVDEGTLLTADEVLAAPRPSLLAAEGPPLPVAERSVVRLDEWDLALLRAPGEGPEPLVVGAARGVWEGCAVALGPFGPRARLTGTVPVRYAPENRAGLPPHRLQEALRLVPAEAEAERYLHSPEAPGTPLLDTTTGAVLGVVARELAGRAEAAHAVPLPVVAAQAPEGVLAAVLRRNAANHPAFGRDLNLAGALHLTAASAAPAVERHAGAVARPQTSAELAAFTSGRASVAALVGEPGEGRTTELAALAVRRARGPEPAPTVWLRGAELRPDDAGLREAVGRALLRSGRILAASLDTASAAGEAQADPDVVARLARDAGRPLLVVLDAPEEMPVALASDLLKWAQNSAGWLGASGARLAVCCRPEFWEYAGRLFPSGLLHEPSEPARDGTALPPCIRLDPLPSGQAARLRRVLGVPEGALAAADAAHPLAVRLCGEVRAAQRLVSRRPGAGAPLTRRDVFAAHLDAVALRVALHLTSGGRTSAHGSVSRLAARAAGRLHEAARRCLGPGQGELDRSGFEEIFPWAGGWAPAVLAEEVLLPAGDGYRFADEEFGEWLQGRHLRLDAALAQLTALVGESGECSSVPRYRLGTVVEALLWHGERCGPAALGDVLAPLVGVAVPEGAPAEGSRREGADCPDARGSREAARVPRQSAGAHDGGRKPRSASGASPGAPAEPRWWAARLLVRTLPDLPDAACMPVVEALAVRLRALVAGGGVVPEEFGPWFWRRLPLAPGRKAELLRLLVPADDPSGQGRGRFLDLASELLEAAPDEVRPVLCGWFADTTPLTVRHRGVSDVPTVAAAAQALLYARRRDGVQHLVEVLAEAAHPRADELLEELLEEEPAAFCRAVHAWATDARPRRRALAAEWGVRVARRAEAADLALLRAAALALRESPADSSLHGAALAVLVRDPGARAAHLPSAVARFVSDGGTELARALGTALDAYPEQVVGACRERLRAPEAEPGELLAVLDEVRTAEAAARVARVFAECAEQRPEAVARAVSDAVDGSAGGRTVVLRAFLRELLDCPLRQVRRSLAEALAPVEGDLRDELLAALIAHETAPTVLRATLCALVRQRSPQRDGAHVGAVGTRMATAPGGTAGFDALLGELAVEIPGVAAAVAEWVDAAPEVWSPLLGPAVRRACLPWPATGARPRDGEAVTTEAARGR